MRILAPGRTDYAAAAPAARRTAGGGFSVAEHDGAPATLATAPAPALTSLDALLELQGFDDPRERRKRAVKRGRGALDALDALKIGVLSGSLDAAALGRLKTLAGELDETTGDARLDSILAEIGLRAAVELAKYQAAEPVLGSR
jgi:hypothetical protein